MLKIVIADDEDFIRRGYMSLKWEELGIEVAGAARNGMEVLELLEKQHVDILLTDIRMPGMTGIELSRKAFGMQPGLIIILLTGYGEFSYAQEALRLGIFDYILKPSTPKEIFACVGRAKEKIQETELRQREMSHYAALEQANQVLSNKPSVSPEEEEELIGVIVRYLGEHYAENVTLASLAEVTHFHTGYLSRYIKQKTGQNFLSILTGIRISHAAKLLLETELKNYEVAERVGIADERYFGQVFKKAYGVTPSQYKKAKKKEAGWKRSAQDGSQDSALGAP